MDIGNRTQEGIGFRENERARSRGNSAGKDSNRSIMTLIKKNFLKGKRGDSKGDNYGSQYLQKLIDEVGA